MDLSEIIYVSRAWAQEEVFKFWEISASYSGYKKFPNF